MRPPLKLIYQKRIGMLLSAFRSEAIHWTSHREKNSACPKNPIPNQMASVVVMESNKGLG